MRGSTAWVEVPRDLGNHCMAEIPKAQQGRYKMKVLRPMTPLPKSEIGGDQKTLTRAQIVLAVLACDLHIVPAESQRMRETLEFTNRLLAARSLPVGTALVAPQHAGRRFVVSGGA